MKKTKVIVIGHGYLGKWHVQKSIDIDSIDLVGIVENSESQRKEIEKKYSDLKVFSDLDSVDIEYDAAIIVTPTSTHFSLIQKLAERGKHIFCEKPLCSNSEQVQKIEEVLNKEITLQVGHSERCHQVWEHKTKLAPYLKGQWTFHARRLAPFKGRALDVDVVQDLMIHDLDLLLWLTEKRPVKVRAVGHKVLSQNWDHLSAQIDFENGESAFIESGRTHPDEVRSISFANEYGTAVVDLVTRELKTTLVKDGEFLQDSISYEQRDHLFIEQQEFAKSVLSKTKPQVSFEEGKAVIKIMDAILKSASENKEIHI